MHEQEADDGSITERWEDLPDVTDFPTEQVEGVEVGEHATDPIFVEEVGA